MSRKLLSLKNIGIALLLFAVPFCVHAHFVGDRRNLFVRDFYFKVNLQRINQAIVLYAGENGTLPAASTWADLIKEKQQLLFEEDFITPMSYDNFGIFYNNALQNKPLSNIKKDTVVLFTARGDWNSNGNKKVFYENSTGRKYYYVITLSGDVYRHNADDDTYRRLKDSQIIKSESLYWD